jgi:septal ring factor EnvC (AmiA/AmiB activator)
MYYNTKARKESFQMVRETCPHVDAALAAIKETIKQELDAALNTAEKSIKIQTEALRDSLIEALDRALTAEDQVAELENRVAELESQLENHA